MVVVTGYWSYKILAFFLFDKVLEVNCYVSTTKFVHLNECLTLSPTKKSNGQYCLFPHRPLWILLLHVFIISSHKIAGGYIIHFYKFCSFSCFSPCLCVHFWMDTLYELFSIGLRLLVNIYMECYCYVTFPRLGTVKNSFCCNIPFFVDLLLGWLHVCTRM